MPYINCFDIVEMVTNEATSQFKPMFRENPGSKNVLRQYCDVLDTVAKEFDCESLDVEVDDIKMTITVRMDVPDIVLRAETHAFYSISERAISVSFSHGEGDTVSVEFVFPGIWERA